MTGAELAVIFKISIDKSCVIWQEHVISGKKDHRLRSHLWIALKVTKIKCNNKNYVKHTLVDTTGLNVFLLGLSV